MADHLISGLVRVEVMCGHGRCQEKWRQDVTSVDGTIGTLVCPRCLWAAPANISRDVGPADFEPEGDRADA